MGTIKEIYNKVNKVKQYLPDQVETIVAQLAEKILELNTEGQLFQGIDNRGDNIGVYKPITEQMSRGITGKGYPKNAGDPFNMYASGELFKSIDAIFKNNQLEFYSKIPNHPFLMKYPDPLSLLGLTPEHQHELNYEMILPKLRQWVIKAMN